MAIDFSYTLTPNESKSLSELQKFFNKVAKKEVEIKLNFNSLLDAKLGKQMGEELGKGIESGLEKNTETIRRATERQIELVKDRLSNSLNNLSLKADNRGLQGLIPVEDIIAQINQLGNSGESLRKINLMAAEIRTELQMWGQALNNDSRELEEVVGLSGKLVDKVADQKLIAATNKELQAHIALRQKYIDLQIKNIKDSKEYNKLTAQQQTAFNNLANSMKIVAYSTEGVNKQFDDFNAQLVEQKQLMQDKQIDSISSAYDKLGGTIQNLVIRYTSLQLVLHQMKKYIQEAIQYTFDLDEAYTDVAISMNVSRDEFNKWVGDAQEIARANGIATSSVMDMVKIYATAGEDIGAISDKLAGTAMIQNITQFDADTTTSIVNSIVNQFKLMDKEINGTTGNISNAINYLGDNLIAISNALSIDNVKGIQEMANAIDDAGSVINSAGGSLEWYMAVTGALAEATNSTGSEIGATMRMVTARTLRQGDAVSELEAQGEDLEFAMSKAEKALKSIGITIRGETADELRGIEEIIDDVAKSWDTLSDSQRQAVAEAMAGTQRSSMFSALIENYEKVKELQAIGLEAEGELEQANQKRVDSLAGIQGQLEVTKEALYATIMNEQDMENFLRGMDSFLQNLTKLVAFVKNNAIPIFIALATIDLQMDKKSLIFKGFNKIGSITKNVLSFAESLIKTEEGFGLSARGAKLFKASLAGLAFVVGTQLIKAFNEMTPSVEQLSMELDELKSATEEYKRVTEEVNQTKLDIQTAKEKYALIKQENLSFEEQKEIVEEVNGLLSSHASSYESISEIISDENGNIEYRIELLEREVEMQEKLAKSDMINALTKKEGTLSWLGIGATTLEKFVNTTTQAKRELKNLDEELNNTMLLPKEREKKLQEIENVKAQFDTLAKDYVEQMSTVENLRGVADDSLIKIWESQLSQIRKVLEEAKNTYGIDIELFFEIADTKEEKEKIEKEIDSIFSSIDYFSNELEGGDTKVAKEIFEDLKKKLNETKLETDETEMVFNKLRSTFKEMPSDINSVSEAMDYLNKKMDNSNTVKTAFKSYISSLEKLEEAQKLLESFSEGLSTSELKSIFESDLMSDFEFGGAITAQEHLKNKIEEMEETASQAYYNMIKDDENFWNSKMRNSDMWLQHEKEMQNQAVDVMANALGIQTDNFAQYINEKGGMRSIDLDNANTMAEAENATQASLVNQLLTYYTQYANDKGQVRQEDLVNVVDFLNKQGVAEAQTIEELVKLWRKYYNAKKAEITNSISAMAGDYQDLGNVDPELMKQLHSLQRLNETMGNAFNGIDITFNGISTPIKQNAIKPNKVGNSSSSSGKGGSSSTKKEVADIDLKIDAYHDLNDAINDVTNAIKLNQAMQENSSGVKKAKLMREEIELLKEQHKATGELIDEQKRQEKELAKQISAAGGTFDNNGDIKNRAEWLTKLQKQVNSLTGEAKENKKTEVEALMEVIKQYEELHNNTLPNTQIEYEQLVTTIKELEKDHLKFVTDLQKDISSAIEDELKKRTDVIKTELEKQKDLYNQQFDEENFERQLASEQRKLDEIQQQIDLAMLDTTEAGKLYLEQLRQEYEQQEEVINDIIRDKEHELGQNRFDEEMDRIDKELEDALDPKNIADLVNQALVDGFVTIGDEVVELDSLMSQWLDQTGDGLYAIGDIIESELIDNIRVAQGLLKELGVADFKPKARTASNSEATTVQQQNRIASELEKIDKTRRNEQRVQIGSLLTVEGNVTEDSLPWLESKLNKITSEFESLQRALLFD